MNESKRLGSIKQEILDLKNGVSILISNFKDENQQKFETMNNRLNIMDNCITTIIAEKSVRVKLNTQSSRLLRRITLLRCKKRLKFWKNNFQKTDCIWTN